MKLKFQGKKGARMTNQYWEYTTFDGWWWNEDKKEWQQGLSKESLSSHAPCKSIRAFRRKLKKSPMGVKFVLVSRWVGLDVYGVGSSTSN